MNEPSNSGPTLWDRLRSAQDRALADGSEGPASERSEVAQLARLAQMAAKPESRSRSRLPRLALGLGVCAAALAGLYTVSSVVRRRSPEIASPRAAPDGRALVAEAGSELPLRFPGGSTITFLPGSSGQMQRLGERGAEVEIRWGRLDAHVVHAAGVRWVVRAGPFRVHVTGTRFGVDWSPATGVLAVTLNEGSVVVDGGVLGAGVPLRAGQKLRVGPGGVVRTEAADLRPQALEQTDAPASDDSRPTLDWRALAERGAYREALRAAERGGLEARLGTLDPQALLALGDVARYAGAPDTAARTFERLVVRFPRHRLAADAVFSLGRLSFEAGRPDRAAGWFSRYVRRWPDGPLAEQAAGRLVESAARAGNTTIARRAARDYLQRSPGGAYAALARSMLDDGGAHGAAAP